MNLMDCFLEKNRNNKLKIYCVGDNLLDQYYEISVNRISPEAPTPILLSKNHNPIVCAGGAANVASQFTFFNVDCLLFGFSDQYCNWKNIGPNLSLVGGRIPVKSRFLDSGMQVVRWDIEDVNYGLSNDRIKEYRGHVMELLDDVPTPNIIIFSDYGKGLFDDQINWVKNLKNAITLVDPKFGPLTKWEGCNVFKPNAQEAKSLSGLDDWKEQSDFFQNKLKCEAVVITQSGKGVGGKWGDEYFNYVPKQTVNVRSVVGAGDAFISFLAMAIGHGFKGEEAVAIAYEAGANYVQGIHNQPITPCQLSQTKIIHPEDLKHRNFSLAFCNGCYDIIHSGHIQTLKFASEKADKLLVAINSDSSVKRLKGSSRPIKPLEERLAVMAALEMVDFVTWFEEDTPLEIIKKCMPDALIKGSQYKEGEIVGEGIVPKIYRAPMVAGVSTTILLEK